MAFEKMKTGESFHHFLVSRSREIPELNATLTEMTHEKTGTRLVWLDNGARNKTFAITFRTLPENNTGVFHILEHSVLCGSDKYPVREPFVELLKGSLSTFLNAFTFPDKTMYPVASRNDRDFLNLTEVYLDAVLAPAILHDERIFRQEGWHIEQDEAGNLSYKGVVFNEMKGALGDVDDLVMETMSQLLYPDTSYGYVSGGDPEYIPDLTWAQFTDTYRRYYHPSNAVVYLDGAVPEETFGLIDRYFSRFENQGPVPFGPEQTPKAAEKTVYYELSREEDLKDRGRVTTGRILGSWQDKVKLWAAGVLCDMLLGSNESPLKRAVLDAGLAQDVSGLVMDWVRQPAFVLSLDNVRDGRGEEGLEVIRRTLRDLLKDGFSRDELEACLNRFEFHVREPSEPQGIDRATGMMQSTLYDGDPMMYLRNEEDLAALRAWLDTDRFEDLAREMFLETDGLCVLHTLPSHTVGDEKRQKEAARLQTIRDSWTKEDFARNREENERLTAWQQTPDSEAQLNTLPRLTIAEAAAETPVWAETVESETDGCRLLYHPLPCHGVIYARMLFRLTDLTLDELTRVSDITDLYGHLPTAKYDTRTLERLLKKYTGTFSVSITPLADVKDNTRCAPYLVATFSALQANLPEAAALITEILTATDFTKKDSVREIVMQNELESRQAGVQSGHQLGILAAGSHYSAALAASEALDGCTGVMWLHELSANFDKYWDDFSALMIRTRDRAICRARLTLTVTADTLPDMTCLTAPLKQGTPVPDMADYRTRLPKKLGLRVPAQVGFGVQACHVSDLGLNFTGSMLVLGNILSLSYYWNVVRVQGGAYGTGIRARKNGLLFTYSYRDPTPGRSVDLNHGASQAVRDFVAGSERLDGFIISTLNDTDPLATSRDMGATADTWALTGWNAEMEKRVRAEILSTTDEELLRIGQALNAFADEGAVCVVGAADMLGKDLEVREI